MKKNIAIGIVGLGTWGKKYLQTLEQFHTGPIYLCDINNQKIEDLNLKSYITLEYRKIVERKDIKAVIITTPDQTHYSLARDALIHDKDVLVEKPMTLKTSEAHELVEIAQNRRLVLAVAHTPLFTTSYKRLSSYLKSNQLINVIRIEAVRTSRGRENISSPLWDLASHDIAIAVSLLGKPRYFSCSVNTPELCRYELGFANGLTFAGEAKWTQPPFQRVIRIFTQNEVHEYHEPIGNDIPATELPPLTQMCQNFIESCVKRLKPVNNGELGKQVVECLEIIDNLMKINNHEIICNNSRI
ncbi:MAG: Gfo/Idh/MocA family oxidoreductase [candidate division WOR-3 bacterium]